MENDSGQQTEQPAQKKSTRDRLREIALAERMKSKVVEFGGMKFMVKEAGGDDYSTIDAKADTKFLGRLKILIATTYEVDENEQPVRKVFEAGDLEVLRKKSPSDPLIKLLADTQESFTNVEKLEAEATKSA